ncbi:MULTISPECIES: superoxide dismutase [Cu-Zn] SodC [unclassified Neisseria]|uniref:superoxide dismutase [Cu-Zn] SodC n=1 Tax=unclassified Neisseria TaxID=2623750 RepID=UPI002666A419|nr:MULTISPECIES: superoxide dismutase [Cu-Zn] SodC [unclassified Neisseria]MDO1509893.1 superoxide dismutase [Cu-Zn] SodC [Neisseria sp. MVDL19-042950]MDO1516092.1 superoxide dismutase [Cu-Zn] SodC [Neisseria sp. MVDL18-041461]MDO1563207.1 superoxide dismutase [Cu-Zn] SodC [Neisseria sp. MVDL20-010259]
MKKTLLALICCLSAAVYAQSEIVVPVSLLNAKTGDKPIGEIRITQNKYGAVFTPNLHGLTEGIHGFHVHEKPSCAPAMHKGKLTEGHGAGGHWDPAHTGAHKGPWDDSGHLGDLPALTVTADGKATQPVLAPRIKNIEDLRGHSLMIHEGGDNHHDHPVPLGGGGHRMACGVIR